MFLKVFMKQHHRSQHMLTLTKMGLKCVKISKKGVFVQFSNKSSANSQFFCKTSPKSSFLKNFGPRTVTWDPNLPWSPEEKKDFIWRPEIEKWAFWNSTILGHSEAFFIKEMQQHFAIFASSRSNAVQNVAKRGVFQKSGFWEKCDFFTEFWEKTDFLS